MNFNGLTLYGSSISGNCLKPKWTADLLGVPYTWVELDLLRGETRSDDFLAMNPAGQVPVAQFGDGRVLTQSNAIMLLLAESAGESGGRALIADDPFIRAQTFSWLFWEQYSHETAIAVRRWQKHYLKKSDDEIDPNLLPKGRRALGVMAMHLTREDWFAGGEFSVADIALVAYTRVAHEGGFDIDEFPAVARWVSRTEDMLGLSHARARGLEIS
jgi:glutathione S-transferase